MTNSQDRKTESDLTEQSFTLLLKLLDHDLEQASYKYEYIRRKLIKIFTLRGCSPAEDLADETIDRVVRRLGAASERFEGDPTLYFYGAAHNVFKEYVRRMQDPAALPIEAYKPAIEAEITGDDAARLDCLNRCLQNLSPNNRELIITYYQGEKRAKIDARKRLAAELGIPLNALRIRTYRIKNALEKCVRECMRTHTS